MGFITRDQKGSKFLNFKDGKIVHSEGGEQKTYDGFSGMVIDLDIEDAEYNGKEYRKVILFIEDTDSGMLYELGFDIGSGYGNAFCCIAPNVNWTKPVEISGKTEKKLDGKKYTGVFIRQEDKPVKWFYTKAFDEDPKNAKKKRPAVEEVMIGKQKVFNFSKRNEFYENMLVYLRKNKIVAATGGLAAYKTRVVPKRAEDVTEPIDDLPF